MVKTVHFQLLLEYDLESYNVFAMYRDIVDFEKEMVNKNGEERGFESQRAKEEGREKTMSFFFLGRRQRYDKQYRSEKKR